MRVMTRISSLLERMSLRKLSALEGYGEWLDARGARVHTLKLPKGRPGAGSLPPLVLVHGLGSNAGSYGALMRHAHPHFKWLAAPSAPAHGLSPYHHSVEDPEALFEIWVALLDQLSAEEPVLLLGTSLGGAIAVRYALERPSRVVALALCSPAGPQMTDDEINLVRSNFRMDRLSDGARFLGLLFHHPPALRLLLGLAVRMTLGGELIQGFLRGLTPEVGLRPEELSALTTPTLLIWGQSERVLPRGVFERYQRCIPSQLLTILEPEGFGHSPQIERPQELLAALLAWLPTPLSAPTQRPHSAPSEMMK